MESRFCNILGEKCTPELWLTQQGQQLQRWPRMGTLNAVTLSEESSPNWPVNYVYDCADDATIYPEPEDGEDKTGTCGCYHCESVWTPKEIIDIPKDAPLESRDPGRCINLATCGKNLAIEGCNGLYRPDVPCYQPWAPHSRKLYESDPDIDTNFIKVLKEVCPIYYNNRYNSSTDEYYTEVCCERGQIVSLSSQFGQIEQLLGRCPACAENVLAIYCHTTCEPNSAQWVNPLEGYYNDDRSITLTARENFLTAEYMDRIFDSCIDVSFPQTNGKVVESLMCDGKTGDDCNSKVWLDFQGAVSNGFSPLDLIYTPVYSEEDYIHVDPKIVPLDYPSFTCSAPYLNYQGDYTDECSCQDCDPVCPALPAYTEDPGRSMIGSLDEWAFIAVMTFVCTVVIFAVVIVVRRTILNQCLHKGEKTSVVAAADGDNTEKIVVLEDITRLEKFGYNFDKTLREAFEFWARNVVCRFPVTTIIISLAWSIALSAGLYRVEFTTGPLLIP